jgi:hypothetical protein
MKFEEIQTENNFLTILTIRNHKNKRQKAVRELLRIADDLKKKSAYPWSFKSLANHCVRF